MNAEQLAQKFHETYERLALDHSYETRKDNAVPWERVPEKNKKLMTAVCSEILEALPQLRFEKTPDYGDIFLIEEFVQAVKSACFTNDDGSGYFALDRQRMSNVPAVPSEIYQNKAILDGWNFVVW